MRRSDLAPVQRHNRPRCGVSFLIFLSSTSFSLQAKSSLYLSRLALSRPALPKSPQNDQKKALILFSFFLVEG